MTADARRAAQLLVDAAGGSRSPAAASRAAPDAASRRHGSACSRRLPALIARGVNVDRRPRRGFASAARSSARRRWSPSEVPVAFRFVVRRQLPIEPRWRPGDADGMACAPREAADGRAPAAAADRRDGRADTVVGDAVVAAITCASISTRLDELMRMIGDLVIMRARLDDSLARVEPHVPPAEWRVIQEHAGGIERQLRDLREGVMRVRLVPVGEIFRRMPFVVRDLARETGRKVQRRAVAGRTPRSTSSSSSG